MSDQLGQAEVLNSLGELSLRLAATGDGRHDHAEALHWHAPSARSGKKHEPSKDPRAATCTTATPSTEPLSCGKRSPSTSAPVPPQPAALKKRSQPCPAEKSSPRSGTAHSAADASALQATET